MYKRKLWLFMSLVMVLVFMLAACQPSNPATSAPTQTEAMAAEPTATEAMAEPTATEAMAAEPMNIDCMGAQAGDEVSLLYQWSGVEEQNLNTILQPLVDACGIVLQPESTRDQALLDTRVQAGTPPDIAFWNVVQLEQYQDELVAMPDLGVQARARSRSTTTISSCP